MENNLASISTEDNNSIIGIPESASISTTGESVPIIRGKIPSLTIYEISEAEFGEIINGSTASIYFNLLMFFGGIFFPTLTGFWLIDYKNFQKAWILNSVVCVCTLIASIIMLILWIINKKSLKTLIQKIKDRVPK